MKTTYRTLFTSIIAILSCITSFAQYDSGIITSKYVTKDSQGDGYTLTLEAYATGETQTIHYEGTAEMDIVVIADVRGSSNGGWGDLNGIITNTNNFVNLVKNNEFSENGGSVTTSKHRFAVGIATPDGVSWHTNVSDPDKNYFESDYSKLADALKTSEFEGEAHGTTSDMVKVFNDVNTLFNDHSSTRARLVILIGLGHIGTNQWKDKDSGPETVKVVNVVNTTKTTYSASVYTICTDTANGPKTAMRLISSDYQGTLTNFTYNPTWAYSKYAKTASSAEELSSAFTSIAQDVTTGGSSTSLTASNSSIRDYITPEFKLNNNTGVESILVFTNNVNTSASTSGDPQWTSDVPVASNSGINVSTATNSDGITSVIITGFDFKDNWVGIQTNNNNKSWHPGKKIVIKIRILLNENAKLTGGILETNTTDSGIYSGTTGQREESFTPTGINFDVPSIVLYDGYLHIIKKGLKNGESAVFNLTSDKTSQPSYTVMVTNKGNDGESAEAIVKVEWLKLDRSYVENNQLNASSITDAQMVNFTVSEQNWTWADSTSPTPAPAPTSHLYIIENGRLTLHKFTFDYSNPRVDQSLKYDETYKILTR